MNTRIRYLSGLALMVVIAMEVCLPQLTFAASGTVSPANSVIGGKDDDAIGSRGVTMLPNGNMVIDSPLWNNNNGAVTCLTPSQYKAGGVVVSAANSLVGDVGGNFGDRVGDQGITVLATGNYVVDSAAWNGNRGAVTLGKADCSTVGAVSASNSLVGSTGGKSHDSVGDGGITTLSNGNYVVGSPQWNNGAGAVTWVNGTTGLIGAISITNSLISDSRDEVGSGGVQALTNGNYVITSSAWGNKRGAVTWGNGLTGIVGTISASNSLVGSTGGSNGDQVGFWGNSGVTVLPNSNYVVNSAYWNYTTGAVTWANGTTGLSGIVSASNSLVGSSPDDRVGSNRVQVVGNGTGYAVSSSHWNSSRGAVTWGSSASGVRGLLGSDNSLVGDQPDDSVGRNGVKVLVNGNYVVASDQWHSGSGAVTWASGTVGTVGAVSLVNSLTGSQPGDQVGLQIYGLTNGNYVIDSRFWHTKTGAVTWASGTTPISGTVGVGNSLVGSTSGDYVGENGVTALDNGNYVVASPYWNGYRGAATWASGTTGLTGLVSVGNSLVGSLADDGVASADVQALPNGNYLVASPGWSNAGATRAGAVTWGNGTSGITGTVNSTNSLVGSHPNDQIGLNIVPLTNGNYVVVAITWSLNAGAVTWGNGTTGVSGTVSRSNSLVGSTGGANEDSLGWTDGDQVGSDGVRVVGDGTNYVVASSHWNGRRGAVTWGNGASGIRGVVGYTNSLVGTQADDDVGVLGVHVLSNGNYVVNSYNWHSGTGAVTLSNGTTGKIGTVSRANSLTGSTAHDYVGMYINILPDNNYVVVSPYWNNGHGAVTWASGAIGD